VRYSADDIQEMAEALLLSRERADNLRMSILSVPLKHKVSKDYAHQGFLRRLNYLDWSIDRVFDVLPPDALRPCRTALIEAATILQAFLMNTVGALDNLARVWCIESDARDAGGNVIPDSHIGLGPENRSVRLSLSASCQGHLAKMNEWFAYLKNYRDAFAHRIPLYIPAQRLGPDDETQYRALEEAMQKASQQGDYQRWEELNAEQDALGQFVPVMMHSFGPGDQDGRLVPFHRQMLRDFITILDLGELMLKELRSMAEPHRHPE
jgi:hypothetical protein